MIDSSLPTPSSKDGLPVIVVGASSGGTEALKSLVEQLPADFPACVLVVRHFSPQASAGHLVRLLNKHGALETCEARDGVPLAGNRIFVAQSDKHLLVDEQKLWVIRGARENRWRPAVDPLFRSAAVAHGNRVIGVILSGHLDDGAAGLSAVKRCGGVTVVQDPDDALFPGMPQSALHSVKVDHCVPVAEMGALLADLVKRPAVPETPPPLDLQVEAKIAARVLADPELTDSLGELSTLTCPECGGVLWKVGDQGIERYRCHTGHAYSPSVLLADQTEKIEETLWVALRMFEERKMLLSRMAKNDAKSGIDSWSERINEAEVHIRRIRELLMESREPID